MCHENQRDNFTSLAFDVHFPRAASCVSFGVLFRMSWPNDLVCPPELPSIATMLWQLLYRNGMTSIVWNEHVTSTAVWQTLLKYRCSLILLNVTIDLPLDVGSIIISCPIKVDSQHFDTRYQTVLYMCFAVGLLSSSDSNVYAAQSLEHNIHCSVCVRLRSYFGPASFWTNNHITLIIVPEQCDKQTRHIIIHCVLLDSLGGYSILRHYSTWSDIHYLAVGNGSSFTDQHLRKPDSPNQHVRYHHSAKSFTWVCGLSFVLLWCDLVIEALFWSQHMSV